MQSVHNWMIRVLTVEYLRFHSMVQCVKHALKGLACRARASSPASHRKQRSAHAAVPVLLAHAEVTRSIIFFNGSKTKVPTVPAYLYVFNANVRAAVRCDGCGEAGTRDARA